MGAKGKRIWHRPRRESDASSAERKVTSGRSEISSLANAPTTTTTVAAVRAMSTRSLLPSSLLDLAWLRLSAQHGSCVHARSRLLTSRSMHALATAPAPSFQPPTEQNPAISASRCAIVAIYLVLIADGFRRGRRKRRSSTSLAVRRPGSLVSNAMAELERRVGALSDAAMVETEVV